MYFCAPTEWRRKKGGGKKREDPGMLKEQGDEKDWEGGRY